MLRTMHGSRESGSREVMLTGCSYEVMCCMGTLLGVQCWRALHGANATLSRNRMCLTPSSLRVCTT